MSEGQKMLRAAGVTVSVFVILKYLLPYVLPFLIAYILVHVINPLTEAVRRKIPWKKEVITAVLLVIILSVLGFAFYWIYCILMNQLKHVAVNFNYYYSCFCEWVDKCCSLAENSLGIQGEEIRELVYSGMDQVTEQIEVYLVPNMVNYSVRYLKKLFDVGLFLVILFVAVILLMRDYDEMKKGMQKYSIYQHMHAVTDRMWKQGGAYLKAQMLIIGIEIILCTSGLWVLDNPYFLLLGIVIGMMDALPFIGTGTVLVPITLYYLLNGRVRLAAGYAGLFLLSYMLREFLEPRVLGKKLGIYPFVMVILVYVGLYLFGISGVFLGPVMFLLVREILREFEKETEVRRPVKKQ